MKLDICHNMAPLQMLYIMTLTHIFKVTNFEMWLYKKRWKLVQKCPYTFYAGWYLLSKGVTPVFLLHDLYLNFQGRKFKILLSHTQ